MNDFNLKKLINYIAKKKNGALPLPSPTDAKKATKSFVITFVMADAFVPIPMGNRAK